MSSGFENVTREQSKQLLEHLMYRIRPEARETLAACLPAAYNAYCGRDIVRVVSTDTDTGADRIWHP